jgi:sterol-4alpha-carboxylate 3-dehydrogenase (decarboxylating)
MAAPRHAFLFVYEVALAPSEIEIVPKTLDLRGELPLSAATTLPNLGSLRNSSPPRSACNCPLHLNMSRPQGPASLGKVVVVGGCGFLGSHIVKYIVERHPQTQVAVLDLRTNSNRNASSNVSYHDADITDLAAIIALFSKLKPDAIIHTASPHFDLKPEIHDKVNVGGTKNLVKAAQDTGVKAFVYTSSASVILGATEPLVNADERWPIIAGKAQPEYYTTTKVRRTTFHG